MTEGLCKVISRGVGADLVAAVLIFPRSHTSAVNRLLGRENLAQVRLPRELAGSSLEEALAAIRRQLQVIPHEIAEVGRRLQELAQTWRPRLLAWRALLHDHLARIDVRPDSGQTDHTFVIEGWVPEDRLPDLQAAIEDELAGEVFVQRLPVGEREKAEAPVVLANPALVRPFEPLIQLLGLPHYGGLDPSPLLSLFFPI